MCIKLGINMFTAVRSHIIWTEKRWILCREKKVLIMCGRNAEIIIVNHTMNNTCIDQTCLIRQVCFSLFINDGIRIGVRVLKEKSKKCEYYSKCKSNFHAAMYNLQGKKNIAIASYTCKIVIVLSAATVSKNTKVQSLAKILRTSLFKNRHLPLSCDTVLLWLSGCVESLGLMASSGCAYDCGLSSW